MKMLRALTCLVQFSLLISSISGHGFLEIPPARQVLEWKAGRFYQHMAGNGVGPGRAFPNAPGVCGDPYGDAPSITDFANAPFAPVATYQQGAIVVVVANVFNNHGGKLGLNLCPQKTDLTQECFDANPLINVDTSTPNFWIRTSTPQVTYAMRYQLPADISCDDGCVLQWKYVGMQTCMEVCDPEECGPNYGVGYNTVYKTTLPICNKFEMFYNCADIIIQSTKAA